MIAVGLVLVGLLIAWFIIVHRLEGEDVPSRAPSDDITAAVAQAEANRQSATATVPAREDLQKVA